MTVTDPKHFPEETWPDGDDWASSRDGYKQWPEDRSDEEIEAEYTAWDNAAIAAGEGYWDAETGEWVEDTN